MEEKGGLADMVARGEYLDVLGSEAGQRAIANLMNPSRVASGDQAGAACLDDEENERFPVALAALNAFLQINVTGPALENVPALAPGAEVRFGRECLAALTVDGVAPYAYIPALGLFCLARRIVLDAGGDREGKIDGCGVSLRWLRLRVHVWHYKLLMQPHLGAGSTFARSSQWSDLPSLVSLILEAMEGVRKEVLETEAGWTRGEKVECALEMANCDIMLGRDDKARAGIKEVVALGGFEYVLTGALGKRTKFQENSLSQLVVLARSATDETRRSGAQPEALALNSDVLLERVTFDEGRPENEAARDETTPVALRDLSPEAQPQLDPLDQITLLTEATLKDAFSPLDGLTSEEVLPYAQRVLSDKSTNWQVYTQALIVRSRTEVHRSRTVERGVLQMQAVVDQIIVDTTPQAADTSDAAGVPSISVTTANDPKPTSFLPAPKPTESAPASDRLRFVHAVSTPPRWHLESELAYGWAGVGSLVSALEIFKRLRLWAEVALCLASAGASSDDSESGGPGIGAGEEKARGIIRWRLFNRTGLDPSQPSVDADDEQVGDVTRLRGADWMGPERTPAPSNASRLWCILGDVESDAAHYERAWDISGARYSRAQKNLAEHHLRGKDFAAARDAYARAVHVNRLSPEMWSRLGDIHLRLGEFGEAAEAFGRAIGAASDVVGGEDARTWSNLGSALHSMYTGAIEARQSRTSADDGAAPVPPVDDDDDDDGATEEVGDGAEGKDPEALLLQSLNAYKRGANLSRENWRIWDNVLTLASRTSPPSLSDMVLATRNIIRIRNSEDALDEAVLSVLLREGVLACGRTGPAPAAGEVYEPPRGTMEKAVVVLLEDHVVPLITTKSGLWELVSRLRAWRGDYAGAIDASERAWRAAVAGLGGEEDGGEAWKAAAGRTDELVSLLENFGPGVEAIGERWRGKARSAVRSVLGKGRGRWEGGEEWRALEGLMEGLSVKREETT